MCLVKEDKNPFEGEAIVTGSHTINEADEAKMHTLMGQVTGTHTYVTYCEVTGRTGVTTR